MALSPCKRGLSFHVRLCLFLTISEIIIQRPLPPIWALTPLFFASVLLCLLLSSSKSGPLIIVGSTFLLHPPIDCLVCLSFYSCKIFHLISSSVSVSRASSEHVLPISGVSFYQDISCNYLT